MGNKDNTYSKDFGFLKGLYLKNIIDNLGSIAVLDNKIICYVDNKKLRKKLIKESCRMFFTEASNLDLIKRDFYKVNKPVYYIIDGMNFDMDIFVSTDSNTHILFRNCYFTKSIGIRNANEVVFENNKYCDDNQEYILGECFLYGRQINTLRFINDNFINLSKNCKSTKFAVNVETLNLEVINSRVCTGIDGHVSLISEKLKLQNSSIHSSKVYIKTAELEQQDFTISADEWEILNCGKTLKIDDSVSGFQKTLNRNK